MEFRTDCVVMPGVFCIQQRKEFGKKMKNHSLLCRTAHELDMATEIIKRKPIK
jgi:hypothetical protein